MYKQQLLERIGNRSATIGIIGLGYVGLPLAVAFAQAGFKVIGLDLDAKKVEMLRNGQSYVTDVPSAELATLVREGKPGGSLSATTHYADLRQADIISICVPTPLRKTKDPDMSYVISATESVAAISHAGMLIVLESTTYPGTTEEILVPRMRQAGLKPGEDVFIAFSPERIDPGNKHYGVKNTPKVVGGFTEACSEVTHAYYATVADQVVRVSTARAAEMVKLLENTFRAVNIGLVNEMALMCDKLAVDVWEVISAAATKPFGFMPFYPGPGLGGHCIPIDPLYLSWKLKTLNYTARFIELASEVNTSMPVHVVNKIAEALNDDSKAVRGARIAVLGAAYKRDVDDVRESPALDIIQLLNERGALVTYHDPHVPSLTLEHGKPLQSVELTAEWLRAADCVVIVTNHSVFDYRWVVENCHLLIDTRNATAAVLTDGRVIGARVVRL
ncbi:MAG: nucleotide sugar dehydrogenase [Chloroflexi bacterium CFX4]|nr:nucleotide sugar dehydrogenase [Chloroflexi bacterium CFX4]MDL1922632.1 nucleotide sugar dehydrogenase [Chloroflexi bacterium CFX3]